MSEKLVLVALAYHADDDGWAWPSNRKLREKTGLSRTGVIAQIKKLERDGLLTLEMRYRENGSQTSNKYHLGVHALKTPPIHATETPPLHSYEDGEGAAVGGPLEIQYNIQDEIQVIGDESQETTLNIDEFLQDRDELSREDIFRNALRKSDKLTPKSRTLTPDGCAYIWRNCRSSAGDNGFQAELLVKEKKMLHNSYSRVGEDYNLAVWAVMVNWIAFTKHTEKSYGAFKMPIIPTVAFFVKYVEAAVDFARFDLSSEESGFVQVTAKSANPLTKPNEIKDNGDVAITSDELAAISGDFKE